MEQFAKNRSRANSGSFLIMLEQKRKNQIHKVFFVQRFYFYTSENDPEVSQYLGKSLCHKYI